MLYKMCYCEKELNGGIWLLTNLFSDETDHLKTSKALILCPELQTKKLQNSRISLVKSTFIFENDTIFSINN